MFSIAVKNRENIKIINARLDGRYIVCAGNDRLSESFTVNQRKHILFPYIVSARDRHAEDDKILFVTNLYYYTLKSLKKQAFCIQKKKRKMELY